MARDFGTNATVTSGVGVYPQCNFAASAAPGTGDDNTAGYGVGSIWCDTTADDAYICLDASTGAAVWKKISP